MQEKLEKIYVAYPKLRDTLKSGLRKFSQMKTSNNLVAKKLYIFLIHPVATTYTCELWFSHIIMHKRDSFE